MKRRDFLRFLAFSSVVVPAVAAAPLAASDDGTADFAGKRKPVQFGYARDVPAIDSGHLQFPGHELVQFSVSYVAR